MTMVTRPAGTPRPSHADASRGGTPTRTTLVEVLACAATAHGDDGAPRAALTELQEELPPDVAVRFIGQLGVDDLLGIPMGAGAVVVDTATGLEPGWVAEMDIAAVARPESGLHSRGSGALSRPETLGLASMIRGGPLAGVVVAIGGRSFRAGEGLTWPVAAGIGTFRVAISDAIDRVRGQVVGSENRDR